MDKHFIRTLQYYRQYCTDSIRCKTRLVFPSERTSHGRSGQIEENASDIQFLMQAFTGIEDRLSKIEASTDGRGIVPKISLCSAI